MILVIGSRSKIGSALVDRLVETGEQVRMLVRGGEAAERSGRPGVETVRGDLADEGSLVEAMTGVEKVFLFGSYAKGTQTKDSDIDIAVFSADFSDETKIDDMTWLLMKTSGLGYDIQPQPFTLEDYEEPIGLVEEILRTGLELQLVQN